MAILFPNIDPVALEIGPLVIRWYSLAYIVGFLGGIAYAQKLLKLYKAPPLTAQHIDDFILWLVFGVILGGRIGYVLFYNYAYYSAYPMEALQIWDGGMSFHGGFLGVILATIGYCKRHKINPLAMGDLAACCAPIGIFFGRVANFINGELYGRETDVPWGIIFPRGGDLPRHPSQLYEAVFEGLFLFILLSVLFRIKKIRERFGMIAGFFMLEYATFRFVIEFFREPDDQLGFIIGNLTMGQLLTIPMLMIGTGLFAYAQHQQKN